MDPDPDRPSSLSSRRLLFDPDNFDDYLITVTAKLRFDTYADRVLSGEIQHPLIAFQRDNIVPLQQLNVPWVSPQALLQDPVSPYLNWLRTLTNALLHALAPVSAVNGLAQL